MCGVSRRRVSSLMSLVLAVSVSAAPPAQREAAVLSGRPRSPRARRPIPASPPGSSPCAWAGPSTIVRCAAGRLDARRADQRKEAHAAHHHRRLDQPRRQRGVRSAGCSPWLRAAANGGLKRFGVPLGGRHQVDAAEETIDLLAEGKKLGVEVRELGNLDDAFLFLTGSALPRAAPVSEAAMELWPAELSLRSGASPPTCGVISRPGVRSSTSAIRTRPPRC